MVYSPAILPSMQRDLQVGDLGATLVAPDGVRASALLIQGSGVHDRNGSMPSFNFRSNLYERLARELAARGIASLRYDKRGFNLPADAPRDYSLTTRLADASAALMVLKEQSEVAGETLIIGHSEGALIAAMLAIESTTQSSSIENRNSNIEKCRVVSLAAPFGNVFELNRFRAQKLATGSNSALHARGKRALAFYARLEELFRADKQLTPAEFREFAQPYRDAGFAGWESFGWLREHWKGNATCDPTERGIPMLVIQGGRDNRLWDDNVQRWRQYCETRPLAKFVEIPDMGHDLNDARRKAFVLHEAVTSSIMDWLV
jgi:pimeloyl-ACP methyl ester carboxylesterase